MKHRPGGGDDLNDVLEEVSCFPGPDTYELVYSYGGRVIGSTRGIADTEGIETRYSDEHLALSVFRFDEDEIVTPHLGRLVGHDSPTFHLRRRQADGVFDRFTTHVGDIWERARPAQL